MCLERSERNEAYYGKSICSFAEIYEYIELIESNQDDIFHLFITAYENNINGQTLILEAMRKKEINDIINKEKTFYKSNLEIELFYIFTIVNSYNNPKPAVPLSDEEIKNQVNKLIRKYLDEN